jgi:hypothetical protein
MQGESFTVLVSGELETATSAVDGRPSRPVLAARIAVRGLDHNVIRSCPYAPPPDLGGQEDTSRKLCGLPVRSTLKSVCARRYR